MRGLVWPSLDDARVPRAIGFVHEVIYQNTDITMNS